MIREQFRQKLERRHRTLIWIWIAFVVADIYYVWIVHRILTDPPAAVSPFTDKIRTALWLLAAANVWVIYGVFKKRIFARHVLLSPPAMPKLPAALRDYASPTEEKAAAAVTLYFTSEILTFALAASIGIFGFVLAFLGRYTTDQYLLTLLSLGILAYEFPSKPFLRGLIGEVEIREELTLVQKNS